jgi:hypothetical protein
MSAFGCGPLGMIQKLTVGPFLRAVELAAVLDDDVLLLSLSRPQAATARARIATVAHRTIASFRLILLSSCAKTILDQLAPVSWLALPVITP